MLQEWDGLSKWSSALHWPLPNGDTPVTVLAHRGTPGPWRENTLEAFSAALEAGADGVELDVRRSAEGVALVHHDPDVAGAGPLHTLERAQVPAWVPTLEEALACCAGAVVDVELKNSPFEPGFDPEQRLAGEVAATVRRARAAGSRPAAVFVSSFWPDTLSAARAADGALATGLLVSPGWDASSALDAAEACGAGVLLPFRAQVTGALLSQAHGRGLAVVSWAVDEAADLESMAAAGVDGVVTDHVALALATFGRS